MSFYNEILIHGIFKEIIKVRDAEALSASAIMVYVAIDTMAFLSMSKAKSKNGSEDFIIVGLIDI